MPSQEIQKQIHLPHSRALAISLKSIRIRFARSLITASGIFLGIAFLCSVLTSGAIQQAFSKGVDPAELLAARNRQIWLVAMSLLVSTVGITNAMLMSVTERFKEIGTMKCLGALDRFVVELFILESGMLGLLASATGAFTGWFLMALIAGPSKALAIGFGKTLIILLIGTVIGTVLTLVATIAPAMRAAQMPPAAALRVEI